MMNIFKSKFSLAFFSLSLFFINFPSAYAMNNDICLDCKTNLECDNEQYLDEEDQKLEELEKIILEWIEYSEKFPEDVEGQYEFYKKALDLAKEMGISD